MPPIIRNYAHFLDYCIYGKLKEAQKMISDNSISLSDIDEDIFGYTCYFGQIAIAKWIYSLNPQRYTDICAHNQDLIKTVDKVGHTELAQWMKSI